jgi:hypothetical protein
MKAKSTGVLSSENTVGFGSAAAGWPGRYSVVCSVVTLSPLSS